MNRSMKLSQLRLERLLRGETQFEVAHRAHLSASRLSLLERGHDQATTAERVALATALGAAESELFPVATIGVSE